MLRGELPLTGAHVQAESRAKAVRRRRQVPQIALAWLLRRSRVMLPIPGKLSIEHVRESLGALEIEHTDDEFDALA